MGALQQDLRDVFEGQARWRREKAKEFPDDARNLEAAAIFDRLAGTADAVSDDYLTAFYELGDDVPDGLRESESFSEFLRNVGFQSDFKSAVDLVKTYVAKRTGNRTLH
jgi:hypothetical protein